jgi:4-hydroxy-3-methylbut-2-enyl diphosphate reductase
MGRIDGKVHLVATPEDVERLDVRDPAQLAYVTQTTLSVDDTRSVIEALKRRYPSIVGPDTRDICYATQNRQRAVRELAKIADLILVVGAQNSSNSNRLREIANEMGVDAYLIADASVLRPEWLHGVSAVGVTAGASAPEHLVQQLVDRLRDLGATAVEILPGVEENVRFKMPVELADPIVAAV